MSGSGLSVHNRRWYDGEPGLVQFLATLNLFPRPAQEIVCNTVNELLEKQYHVNQLMSGYRSLGFEKVKRLQFSKLKRRDYDEYLYLHNTINYLGLLSDENLQILLDLMNDLLRYDIDYLNLCKQYDKTASLTDLQHIATTFFRQGGNAVKVFLTAVEKAFSLDNYENRQTEDPKDNDSDIIYDESGKLGQTWRRTP
ncbi:MAG: hypothetical protein KC476_00165 [Cyanobacteria bacterium HKST-UBA06]|nr:hypothetical protein [Cyanobacteria bacterium HKST-UBA06]